MVMIYLLAIAYFITLYYFVKTINKYVDEE